MAEISEKHFISPQDLYADSFRLARRILDSGFRPEFIAAIWRGGTPIGIIVQEFLQYHGLSTDHIAVRTSAYESMGVMSNTIRVHGLNYIAERIKPGDGLLLVDDVFDTGLSIQAVLDMLKQKAGAHYPRQIKTAVLYYKPGSNKTALAPDYYLHQTDKWLVFPHELVGLDMDEIRKFKAGEIQPFFRDGDG